MHTVQATAVASAAVSVLLGIRCRLGLRAFGTAAKPFEP